MLFLFKSSKLSLAERYRLRMYACTTGDTTCDMKVTRVPPVVQDELNVLGQKRHLSNLDLIGLNRRKKLILVNSTKNNDSLKMILLVFISSANGEVKEQDTWG